MCLYRYFKVFAYTAKHNGDKQDQHCLPDSQQATQKPDQNKKSTMFVARAQTFPLSTYQRPLWTDCLALFVCCSRSPLGHSNTWCVALLHMLKEMRIRSAAAQPHLLCTSTDLYASESLMRVSVSLLTDTNPSYLHNRWKKCYIYESTLYVQNKHRLIWLLNNLDLKMVLPLFTDVQNMHLSNPASRCIPLNHL